MSTNDVERYAAGMGGRREVLGDDHVDRAEANKTAFTEDFQAYITRSAWGEIWTRPGLDRRTRSVVTLTARSSCRPPCIAAFLRPTTPLPSLHALSLRRQRQPITHQPTAALKGTDHV